MPRKVSDAFSLVRGEETHVRVVVPSQSESRFEIRDARTGAPVAGAVLQVLGESDGRLRQLAFQGTGPDGLALVRGLEGDAVMLRGTVDGYRTAWVRGVDSHEPRTLWLEPEESETGLGEAEVMVFRPDGSPWSGIGVVAIRDDAERMTVYTDASGRVTVQAPAGERTPLFLVPTSAEDEVRWV